MTCKAKPTSTRVELVRMLGSEPIAVVLVFVGLRTTRQKGCHKWSQTLAGIIGQDPWHDVPNNNSKSFVSGRRLPTHITCVLLRGNTFELYHVWTSAPTRSKRWPPAQIFYNSNSFVHGRTNMHTAWFTQLKPARPMVEVGDMRILLCRARAILFCFVVRNYALAR